MARNTFILMGLVLAVLVGCKKDEVPAPDLGYTYFPTAVGTWVEYQVDSMWRDDLSDVLDSVSYRLLERIEAHYTDLEGRPCQRIHRYVKDEGDVWVVRDVWTATCDEFYAERTEENYRRLKLSFPVRESRNWDINIYGTSADIEEDDELMVAYRDVGEPWTTNGLTFEKTVLVSNTIPPNFVERRNFEERYADGVGMISKYWEESNTQTPNGQVVVKGWKLNMVAVAYGTD